MTSAARPVVLACAADRGYVIPLAAMLRSALDTLSPDRALHVYILDGGLGQIDRERISQTCTTGRTHLVWIRPDVSTLSGLPLWGRMPVSTYFRLLVARLLPTSLPKVLWLDCDLIVQRDLAHLWDQEHGDHAVLAVQDMVVPFVSSRWGVSAYRQLGLPQGAPHFNAGVMVVNLDRWRGDDVESAVLTYVRRHVHGVTFWDQEGLNAALAEGWARLDPRWNVIAGLNGRSFFRPEHLEPAVYRQVVQDPWILHFSGALKPWVLGPRSREAACFYEHVDRTAWAGWRPSRTTASLALSIYESKLRRLLYPAERFAIELSRKRTLRVSPTERQRAVAEL